MKALLRRTLVIVGCLPLALAMGGCAGQAEGERCDSRNGSADCQSGLTCNSQILGSTGESQGLCCPPQGTPSTVAACIPGLVPVVPVSDASTEGASADAAETSEPDAGEASSTVVESEAGEDASVDAATD